VASVEKHTLIITEKPDAAQRIALALDLNQGAKRNQHDGVPYYTAKRDKEILVVPALGHLYTVAGESCGRDRYPVFDYKWVPRYVAERGADRIRTWLKVITELAKDADTFIDACDYDLEGSIIGYCILKYACGNKEKVSKRMKYSTLTKEELEKSYTELLPHLDFALIEAGQTRHEIDWLYGINLSRALTAVTKNSSGTYANLSTGRVQGPILKFLVERERSVRSFVPVPYWRIRAQIEICGRLFEAQYEKQVVESNSEARSILSACKEKNAQVKSIETRQFRQPQPVPFDLGTLQNEAYKLFGYTPRRTSSIAQRLYLDALISYPRTSSQKLPSTIDYKAVLRNLNKIQQYRSLAAELLAKPELKPHEGKKDDPAHPAIYPTGNPPERILDSAESNIWNLVVRRFLAVFSEPAIRQSMKIQIDIDGQSFHLNGMRTLEEGWLRFCRPYGGSEEILLPAIKEGQQISVKKVILEDRFTNPPPRYNPASLLRKMEKTEIGTKATRADIIQTLYDRKYIRDDRMIVTDLGLEILEVLRIHCPKVISVKLTRDLEERMDKISQKDEKREDVIASVVETLKPILEGIKENEKEIGERLTNAARKARLDERIIGPCLICRTGRLLTLYSRKTGKRFVGCSNYFKGVCKTSFPLPQKGAIIPLNRSCRQCGWPTIQIRTKGRRSWILCINSKCPSKRERRQRIEMRSMQQRST